MLPLPGPRGTRESPEDPVSAFEPVFATHALSKFLSGLAERPNPVLVDLGPVVASNLTFFAEQLGCKVFIEDLSRDLDWHVQQGRTEALPAFLAARFPRENGSVDGVLCWDLFDYCDRDAARVLACELTRLLRREGLLVALFSSVWSPDARYTKFVLTPELSLRLHPYPAARPRQQVLPNREIARLFDGLRVSESFLLRNQVREMLFRKPAYLSERAG